MWKKIKFKYLLLLLILFIVPSYYTINSIIDKDIFVNLKSLLSSENKRIIKKYFFPYKLVSLQEEIILDQQIKIDTQQKFLETINLPKLEIDFKKENIVINLDKKIFKLDSNLILEKFYLQNSFFYGIDNIYPGTGFIDFDKKNLLILSSRGIFGYFKKTNHEFLIKLINNNIDDFIGLEQFKKDRKFSIKDLLIKDDLVFISYTEEIKKDCWNTSIIFGRLDYENINFKKLFSSKKCVKSFDKEVMEFSAGSAGGKMVALDDNNILLAVGDYRNKYLAQDNKSINGKIIKINIHDSVYKIISVGHRKPQGLYYDQEENFILETEPGPGSIDELNMILLKDIDEINKLNYGWPIVSGEKNYYDFNKFKKKYPNELTEENGFIKPIKMFIPAIGISEIIKIKNNDYVLSSMKDKSLFFFNLDKKHKIKNIKAIKVDDQIRDLKVQDNKLYLFLENTASLGIIDLKNFKN
jgi:hypothetical protein